MGLETQALPDRFSFRHFYARAEFCFMTCLRVKRFRSALQGMRGSRSKIWEPCERSSSHSRCAVSFLFAAWATHRTPVFLVLHHRSRFRGFGLSLSLCFALARVWRILCGPGRRMRRFRHSQAEECLRDSHGAGAYSR